MWKLVKNFPKFWYNGKVYSPACVSSSQAATDDEIRQRKTELQQSKQPRIRKCCFLKYRKQRKLENEKTAVGNEKTAVENVQSIKADSPKSAKKCITLVEAVAARYKLQFQFTYGTSYNFEDVRIPNTFEAIGLGFIVYLGLKHVSHGRRCHQSDDDDENKRKCPGLANFLFSILWAAGGHAGKRLPGQIQGNRLFHRQPSTTETSAEVVESTKETIFAQAVVNDSRASLSDLAQHYASLVTNNEGEQYFLDGKYGKAIKYFEQASDLGLHQAMYNLGVCYEMGQGVQQNPEQAFHYYIEAGKLGNSAALYNVAICYREGIGVLADEHECLKYMSQASDLGIKEAQTFMGNYYGSHDEYDKAAVMFQKAVDQKHSDAEYFLGLCYEHGLGVESNADRAAELFGNAASSGNAEAAYRLAIFYEHGLGGLEVNHEMSQKLLNEAAKSGHELAIEKLKCDKEKAEEMLLTRLKQSASSPDLNSNDKSPPLFKSASSTSIFDLSFVQHLIGGLTWCSKDKFTTFFGDDDYSEMNDEVEKKQITTINYWSSQQNHLNLNPMEV